MTSAAPAAPRSGFPGSLQANPRLDDWIRIDGADTITVRTGKVELGQGITTALAVLAAEELDVSLQRIRIETADTARLPNEFMTVGSMSIETSGVAVRQAAADARFRLLERAAVVLEVPVEMLSVSDGIVRAPDSRSVSYWQLLGGKTFDCDVTGVGTPKAAAEHRIVGKRVPRIDMPEIVFGKRRYVQDLAPPGVLHGRVVRPLGRRPELREPDQALLARVRALPGIVEVVRDGSFLGVIAAREEQAVAATNLLRERVGFEAPAPLPPMAAYPEKLVRDVVGSYPLVNGVPVEQPVPPVVRPADAAHTLELSYSRPFLMHASIGPSAALARFADGMLVVFNSSQGVSVLLGALAHVVGLPPEQVRLVYVEGPGCYGQNGSDDAALDAALLAKAVPGRSVLLKWSRQDEHAFEPYGPAMRVDVCASLDAAGRISAWNHDAYSYTHLGRPVAAFNAGALLSAQVLAKPQPVPRPRPMLMPEVGIHRNAVPRYAVPAPRIVKHLVGNAPFRTSSLRSLGAFTNVFAIESAMDELAHAAGQDPLAFRLAHLEDPRARAVIEAAAERAGYGQPVSGATEQTPRGRGIAYAQYENYKTHAAIVVDVEVDLATCQIRLLRAVIAADAGQIVDADGLENQLEGGFIQAASWTLKEQVTFDEAQVTSLDWETYPILTFEEVPEVEVVLLDRPDERSLGAGEATTAPTPAAIGNAVFNACGARLRQTPFTPARLRKALFG
jgi:nicotinate dehydrogenase subunit B